MPKLTYLTLKASVVEALALSRPTSRLGSRQVLTECGDNVLSDPACPSRSRMGSFSGSVYT